MWGRQGARELLERCSQRHQMGSLIHLRVGDGETPIRRGYTRFLKIPIFPVQREHSDKEHRAGEVPLGPGHREVAG